MTSTPQTQPQVCARCAADNPAGNRFCGQCGQALMSAAATTGERRPLTVVFCDLVASATLSARLDAEDLSGLLADYHRVCSAAVDRLDGHIAQYLGDGVLIYFGYPRAHEDDALRAVRCGLDILHGLAALNAQAGRIAPLKARLAAHTGRVFVDSVGRGVRSETLAVGDVPNVAARVQSLAQVGTMLVTHSTWALVEGFVHAHPIGEQSLRGIEGAMRLWHVLSDTGSRTRLEANSDRTPYVGRRTELAMLDAAWQRARTGAAVCVLLRADPGQGKSRLAELFGARVSSTRLEVRCTPYGQSSPLLAVVDMVARTFDAADPALDPQERCSRLVAGLARWGVGDALDQGVVASALGLQAAQFDQARALPASEQRRRLMDALMRISTFSLSAETGFLLIEDLHWADASTLELVRRLVLDAPAGPRLTLLTSRPEWRADWIAPPGVEVILLHELDQGSVETMIATLAHGQRLPPDVVREIGDRSDGVPLFVQEITKVVLAQARAQGGGERAADTVRTLSAAAVPASIEAALVSRLDALIDARRTLQVASLLGREFEIDQLQAICDEADARTADAVDRALSLGLVRRVGNVRYEFKHALIRDAAAESLPRRDRAAIHARIARVLIDRFASLTEQRPELVAEHLSMAGDAQTAIEYWLRAGVLALRRSANREATNHLERARTLVVGLSPCELRDRLEMAILNPLGSALRATAGLAAASTVEVYERLDSLATEHGHVDIEGRHGDLRGRLGTYFARSLHEQELDNAMEGLARAEGSGEELVRGLCLRAAGRALWAMGQPGEARDYLERAVAVTTGALGNVRQDIAQDDGVSALVFLGYTLAALGRPRKAISTVEAGIGRAVALRQGTSIGLAFLGAAWTAMILHDFEGAAAYARPGLEHCDRHGSNNYTAWARFTLGWTQCLRGDPVAGLAEMRAAAAASQATGTMVFRTIMLCFIGERQLAVRDLDGARVTLEEALARVASSSERVYEAEVLRVLARLCEAEGDWAGRSTWLAEAQAAAARQGAGLFALRTALDRLERPGSDAEVAGARIWLREVLGSLDPHDLPAEGVHAADLLER